MCEFDLPCLVAAEEPVRNPNSFPLRDSTGGQTQPNRPRVLAVDDQKIIADTISEILQSAGFHALAAYDGCAALEAAAHFRPDYLLSDVLMPRMDGVELAIAIRKSQPAARIVLFSGQAGISEILQRGRKEGYEFELIAKPIHPLKLIERLRQPPI